MWEKYFRIADEILTVKGNNQEQDVYIPESFKIFEKYLLDLFPMLTVETGVSLSNNESQAGYHFDFEELDLKCEFVAAHDFLEFRMVPNGKAAFLQKEPIILRTQRGTSIFLTNVSPNRQNISEFNFLLWNAFGMAAIRRFSVAVHSSVIICNGEAVLFLGESGTGKSTHTQLWLKSIENCKLLNDDSPIVRIKEGDPVCYGSPWSGKSRCYRVESYPIAAIVRLRQSASNQIKKLNKLEAFAALYPSCPPSFSIDPELTDDVCKTISKIIEKVPVYYLDCLPDAAAAKLSYTTIFG